MTLLISQVPIFLANDLVQADAKDGDDRYNRDAEGKHDRQPRGQCAHFAEESKEDGSEEDEKTQALGGLGEAQAGSTVGAGGLWEVGVRVVVALPLHPQQLKVADPPAAARTTKAGDLLGKSRPHPRLEVDGSSAPHGLWLLSLGHSCQSHSALPLFDPAMNNATDRGHTDHLPTGGAPACGSPTPGLRIGLMPWSGRGSAAGGRELTRRYRPEGGLLENSLAPPGAVLIESGQDLGRRQTVDTVSRKIVIVAPDRQTRGPGQGQGVSVVRIAPG
jgi:hypothetical protein